MSASTCDFDALAWELGTLMAAYGEAQARCSDLITQQAAQIAQLQAQAMQLRGALIARDTALAWAREDHRALEHRIPDLPARVTLANRVESLAAKLRVLSQVKQGTPRVPELLDIHTVDAGESECLDRLEASLVAADLVICQTGCLGHGDHWRVEDYCKRTGKPCVVIDRPAQMRIVRIHARDNDNTENGEQIE